MGYTHYWQRTDADLDPARFALFAADVRAIVASTEVALGDAFGQGHPLISDWEVSLNGSKALGQSYETFSVSRVGRGRFEFCKTAQLPYDRVVTACLLALAERFPEVEVSSDGDLGEWADGIGLFRLALGREPVVPARLAGEELEETASEQADFFAPSAEDFADLLAEEWDPRVDMTAIPAPVGPGRCARCGAVLKGKVITGTDGRLYGSDCATKVRRGGTRR